MPWPTPPSARRNRRIKQIAALPYRLADDGRTEVLLITSRETRRWVVPKGNPIKGLASHEAAAHEAFEEAGVNGIPCPTPLGSFHYVKRRRGGQVRDVTVSLFPLAFVEQSADWPEQGERDTRWFALADAAAAVDEPDLAALIAAFRAPSRPAGAGRAVLSASRRTRLRLAMFACLLLAALIAAALLFG